MPLTFKYGPLSLYVEQKKIRISEKKNQGSFFVNCAVRYWFKTKVAGAGIALVIHTKI
jgi:hypothetical protein